MSTIFSDKDKELYEERNKLLHDADEILNNEARGAEDVGQALKMLERVKEIDDERDARVMLKESRAAVAPVGQRGIDKPVMTPDIKTLGQLMQMIYASTFKGRSFSSLVPFSDPEEPSTVPKTQENGWMETKDLVEAIGASGGYLVPTVQGTQLLAYEGTQNVVRQRATVIPMTSRSIQFPVLDQTGSTAGTPNWFGGMVAAWTEEAAQKDETQPSFRQKLLIAYKLACYTEASDEVLMDSIISLEALLASLFQQTIDWFEEEAFVNGTGAGQPLGVISPAALNAPTLVIAPVAASTPAAPVLAVADLTNMLMNFMGMSPVWMMSRRWFSVLMQLNGPAANPSYVFIPNAREGLPAFLFGYPVFFSEHMPLPGTTGSILLADWSKYLVGSRQATTIDASKHFQFRRDLTAWRAVHRVGGNPWLSAPLTYSDGTTQVSPFVTLGATVAT
jgi:HK97 family phage major capsid protein